MSTSPRANRGPAAAAENRAAIIKAAGEIFAEQGLDAPLNAIAKRAGVGQGSLYRNFPTRQSLAFVAFQNNLADIEAVVSRGGTLADVLTMVSQQAIPAPRNPPHREPNEGAAGLIVVERGVFLRSRGKLAPRSQGNPARAAPADSEEGGTQPYPTKWSGLVWTFPQNTGGEHPALLQPPY